MNTPPYSMADYLDSGGYHTDRAAEQGQRALTPSRSEPRAVSAHTRRSTGRCGWTDFLQQASNPTRGRAVWRKCEARSCGCCGPVLRERNLGHDLANLTGHTVVRRVLARSAWRAALAKIKRAEGLRVTYPQPGGMLAVYATAGLTGAVVDDLAESLASDYGRIPDGARICRSREWALRPAHGKADRPVGWRSLGTSAVPERVPLVLQDLGLYRGEVAAELLSSHAWEAHDFAVPAPDSNTWQRFTYAVGLRCTHRAKRRRRTA
jgi:hypothetical protein